MIGVDADYRIQSVRFGNWTDTDCHSDRNHLNLFNDCFGKHSGNQIFVEIESDRSIAWKVGMK